MDHQQPPIILWFRRDLRVADHPALQAAINTGRPIIPLFILDELAETLGAAPKWRLGLGLEAFSEGLRRLGSRLILRRGPVRFGATATTGIRNRRGGCVLVPCL